MPNSPLASRSKRLKLFDSSRRSLFMIPLLFLLTACGGVRPVIKVGLVAPFEGQFRPVGYDAIYAARLAVREINGQGGIGNYRVALVALDDGGNPELAQQVAASLVIDPAVMIVVGHWLTATNAIAAPIYQKGQLPFLALGQEPYMRGDPAGWPPTFLEAYANLTPYDETAGPYAYPTYQAMYAAFALLAQTHPLTRQEIAR